MEPVFVSREEELGKSPRTPGTGRALGTAGLHLRPAVYQTLAHPPVISAIAKAQLTTR